MVVCHAAGVSSMAQPWTPAPLQARTELLAAIAAVYGETEGQRHTLHCTGRAPRWALLPAPCAMLLYTWMHRWMGAAILTLGQAQVTLDCNNNNNNWDRQWRGVVPCIHTRRERCVHCAARCRRCCRLAAAGAGGVRRVAHGGLVPALCALPGGRG